MKINIQALSAALTQAMEEAGEGAPLDLVMTLAMSIGVKPSIVMAAIRDSRINQYGMERPPERETVRWYSLKGEHLTLITDGYRKEYGKPDWLP